MQAFMFMKSGKMKKWMTRLLMLSVMSGGFAEMTWAQVNPLNSQKKLSAEALFRRCYTHLTRARPRHDNPLLLAVIGGTKSATAACMEVLAKAQLGGNGVVSNPSDPEALSVLSAFYDFHLSWFSVKDFSSASRPTSYSTGEVRHHDPTEGGLALTRLLLNPGSKYEEVLTTNPSVRAVRSLGPWVTLRAPSGARTQVDLTVPGTGLDRGALIGVSDLSASNASWYRDNGAAVSNISQNQLNTPLNTLRNFGGGVMGNQSFIWINSGFPQIGEGDNANEALSTVSNASIRMHRRWSKNIMSDLLCRDLPALRNSDVNAMVEEYNTTYPDPKTRLAFRESTTCMACHATVDPMAGVLRNFVFSRDIGYDWDANGTVNLATNDDIDETTWVKMRTPDQPAETKEYHLLHRDSVFFRRPPSGHLRYRSYDGTLVSEKIVAAQPTQALNALGQAIATKNDLYVCAASRYFQYFTGIKAILYDEGDPRNPPLSTADRHYREKVIELGLRLKTHQSLPLLVKDIMESEVYQKAGMRDVE